MAFVMRISWRISYEIWTNISYRPRSQNKSKHPWWGCTYLGCQIMMEEPPSRKCASVTGDPQFLGGAGKGAVGSILSWQCKLDCQGCLEGVKPNRYRPGVCECIHISFAGHHQYVQGGQIVPFHLWIGTVGSGGPLSVECGRPTDYHHSCEDADGLPSCSCIKSEQG